MRRQRRHLWTSALVAGVLLATLSFAPAVSAVAAAIDCCASPCAARLDAPAPTGCGTSTACTVALSCTAATSAVPPTHAMMAATPTFGLLVPPPPAPLTGLFDGRPPTPPPNG